MQKKRSFHFLSHLIFGGRVKKWFYKTNFIFPPKKLKLSNLTHKYLYQNPTIGFLRFLFKALEKVLWPNWSLNFAIFCQFQKKSIKIFSNLNKRYLHQTQKKYPVLVWGLPKGSTICLKEIWKRFDETDSMMSLNENFFSKNIAF